MIEIKKTKQINTDKPGCRRIQGVQGGARGAIIADQGRL